MKDLDPIPQQQPGHIYRLAFMASARDGRDLLTSRSRDASAAMVIQDVLRDRGYRFKEEIYLYPGKDHRPNIDNEIDLAHFHPNDLLLLTTRPPLSDHLDLPRKRIARSYTIVEESVLACVREHLPHCSRVKVVLSDSHARASKDVARFGNVSFMQNRFAEIEAVHSDDMPAAQRNWPDTMAYMIYAPHAWENGPALFASFGMTGETTLGWNHILARRHANLLCTVPFAVVEMRTPTWPERPQTLQFLRDWTVTIHTSHARTSFTRPQAIVA